VALIGVIDTLLRAQTEHFSKGIQKAQTVLGSFGAAATSANSLFAGLAATIGAGVAVTKIVSLTKDAMSLADELGELSNKTSVSVQSLSELRYAAKLTDVEFETLGNGIKKLLVNLSNAASTGRGGASDALKQLGLDAKTLANQAPDRTLEQIADAIANVKSPADRAALAMKLFGKAGLDLLPLLTQGKSGIAALREEARRLGVSLSDVDAEKVNQANDALDRVSFAFEGIGKSLAVGLAPLLEAVAKQFTDAAQNANGFGKSIQSSIDVMVEGFAVVLDIVSQIGKVFRYLQAGASELARLTVFAATPTMRMSKDKRKEFRDWMQQWSNQNQVMLNEADKGWDQAGMGSAFRDWYQGLKRDTEQAAAAAQTHAVAVDEVAEAAAKASEDTQDLIDKLQLQVDTFGMSSEAAKIYELRSKGVDAALIAEAEALTNQLAGLEKQREAKEQANRAAEQLEERATNLIDQIKTPRERLEQQIGEAEGLLMAGLITQEQFDRAKTQFRRDTLGDQTPRFPTTQRTSETTRAQPWSILGTNPATASSWPTNTATP